MKPPILQSKWHLRKSLTIPMLLAKLRLLTIKRRRVVVCLLIRVTTVRNLILKRGVLTIHKSPNLQIALTKRMLLTPLKCLGLLKSV